MMKNLAIALMVCLVLALDLFAAQEQQVVEHSALAMRASTTVGRLHVELRKAANGTLHVKLGYGEKKGGEYADAVSLTLGSSSEVA
jgi:hypothetical protein